MIQRLVLVCSHTHPTEPCFQSGAVVAPYWADWRSSTSSDPSLSCWASLKCSWKKLKSVLLLTDVKKTSLSLSLSHSHKHTQPHPRICLWVGLTHTHRQSGVLGWSSSPHVPLSSADGPGRSLFGSSHTRSEEQLSLMLISPLLALMSRIFTC